MDDSLGQRNNSYLYFFEADKSINFSWTKSTSFSIFIQLRLSRNRMCGFLTLSCLKSCVFCPIQDDACREKNQDWIVA